MCSTAEAPRPEAARMRAGGCHGRAGPACRPPTHARHAIPLRARVFEIPRDPQASPGVCAMAAEAHPSYACEGATSAAFMAAELLKCPHGACVVSLGQRGRAYD